MSEQAVEGAPPGTEGGAGEVVDLPVHGDAAFATLMDALAPEEEADAAGAAAAGGDAAAGAQAGGTGSPAGGAAGAAAGAGGQADGTAAPAPGGAGGTAGDPAGGAAVAAAVGSTAPPGNPDHWDADPAATVTQLGELSVKLEEQTQQSFRETAFKEVQGEHPKYFDALGKHPRLLVGTKVPSLTGNGEETLRSAADAQEWQEALKTLLHKEIEDRAGRALEDNGRGDLEMAHASIEIFQKNPDLIPGTRGFDRELADQLTLTLKPYEVRKDDKLRGYSIPVQPLVESIRNTIHARRAATPAAPAAAGATPPAPEDPPQGGISSKAGAGGGDGNDFSALFGTLGMPDFRI